MKILFLTQVLPYPLDAGPKIRAYYVLRHLAQKHAVTLVSFVRSSDTPQAIAHLKQFCERVITVPMPRSLWRDGLALLRSLLTGTPFLITRDWVPKMAFAIKNAIRHSPFAIVHADQLWMAPYAMGGQPSAVSGQQAKLVLDQHNAVHLIPKRMAADTHNPLKKLILNRETRLMARYESRICQQFDHVVWVTDEDRKVVTHHPSFATRHSPLATRHSIIPICYSPEEVVPIKPLTTQPNLLFLGGMHWPPNAEGIRWFVEEIWPRVRAQRPEARLLVVGKSPPSEIAGVEGVSAPGYVDDVVPFWWDSRFFIVPLRAGGGMRVKIIDAWARGLPVVSTTIGAEGIAYRDGQDILIADAPAAFADAIIRVLKNDTLAQKLAKAGRRTVMEKYNWKSIYQAWDEIYP